MSVWGPGNFDNDSAQDYLGELIAQLIRNAEECLSAENSATFSLDLHGDSTVMPSLDILSLLCEHYDAAPNLEPEQVAAWGEHYLATYDRLIAQTGAKPGYKEERRQVIMETFERLYAITTSWSNDAD